ncbi:MAG: HAAS signaling domain-containing protein [Bacillota bacterium]
MDEKIKAFLAELDSKLSSLPADEKEEALEYYREYINDAIEEGVDAEELLSRLDAPEKIAAMVKAETSIRRAQKNPGIKNYSKAVKYARFNITRPLMLFLFSILIFTTYGVAVTLFLGAFAGAASALILLSAIFYEAFKMPLSYTAEIIGTVGIGISGAGFCLFIAYVLFVLFRLFIRLSAGLIARMMKKPDMPAAGNGEKKLRPARKAGFAMKAILAATVAGLALAFVSGLPVKMFMIFNSMKPANITMHEWEYDAGGVSIIDIETAHSEIDLEYGKSGKIKLTYEQSDWLEPQISFENGQLSFKEKSNGRMPMFSLVSMHENKAALTITLPDSFKAENINLESRGGFIRISGSPGDISAGTYTGSIYVKFGPGAKPESVKARTTKGIIMAGGRDAGQKTTNGTVYDEYRPDMQNGIDFIIETERGSIYFE